MPLSVEDRLRRFVAAHGLLHGVRRLGLAVSGGSDSMALLHLLAPLCRETGVRPVVLCFDHAIRGENSAAEADFVRAAAAALGLDCFSERANPPVAASPGLSIEMAARAARRAFFARAAAALRLDAIATGHQRDDAAETLLLRLHRGSGAAGLSGLRPCADLAPAPLKTIRPLLPFPRDELRAFLVQSGVPWMEDPSNADETIPRNRLRRQALPALAAAGEVGRAALTAALARSADLLREDDAFLETLASDWLAARGGPSAPLALEALRSAPRALARRVARRWLMANATLAAAGFHYVEALLEGPGTGVNLPGGLAVRVRGGLLAEIVRQAAPAPEKGPAEIPLPVSGETRWGAFVVRVGQGGGLCRERGALGSWPASCSLSAKAVAGRALTVRARREGDAFRPLGLAGTQKVQDIFVNGKLPRRLRDAYPLVLCGGELAWIPGYRIAAPFAARPGDPLLSLSIRKTGGGA